MPEIEFEAILDEVSVFGETEYDKEGNTIIRNGDQRYRVAKVKFSNETDHVDAMGWAQAEVEGDTVFLNFAMISRVDDNNVAEEQMFMLMRTNMCECLPNLRLFSNKQFVLQDILPWYDKEHFLVFIENYGKQMVEGTLPSQAERIRNEAPKGVFGYRRLG